MVPSSLLIVEIIEFRSGPLVRIFLAFDALHNPACYLAASVGTTVAGSTSDPGPYAYQFNNPTAISFDSYGYMYILDYNNARVQRWLPGASYGTTVVSASMNLPVGMRFDRLGNMVIADTSYHRVISFGMTCRKYSKHLIRWTHAKHECLFSSSCKHDDNDGSTK